jgi:hypothetical protein
MEIDRDRVAEKAAEISSVNASISAIMKSAQDILGEVCMLVRLAGVKNSLLCEIRESAVKIMKLTMEIEK